MHVETLADARIGVKHGAENSQDKSAAVQAAIKGLTLDAAAGAAHVASISARHFVDNCEIGDFRVAEYNLRVAVTHLREAAAMFREWQGKPLRQGEAR
jgi:hypothetical protein